MEGGFKEKPSSKIETGQQIKERCRTEVLAILEEHEITDTEVKVEYDPFGDKINREPFLYITLPSPTGGRQEYVIQLFADGWEKSVERSIESYIGEVIVANAAGEDGESDEKIAA